MMSIPDDPIAARWFFAVLHMLEDRLLLMPFRPMRLVDHDQATGEAVWESNPKLESTTKSSEPPVIVTCSSRSYASQPVGVRVVVYSRTWPVESVYITAARDAVTQQADLDAWAKDHAHFDTAIALLREALRR